jgi:hypothetical protein
MHHSITCSDCATLPYLEIDHIVSGAGLEGLILLESLLGGLVDNSQVRNIGRVRGNIWVLVLQENTSENNDNSVNCLIYLICIVMISES